MKITVKSLLKVTAIAAVAAMSVSTAASAATPAKMSLEKAQASDAVHQKNALESALAKGGVHSWKNKQTGNSGSVDAAKATKVKGEGECRNVILKNSKTLAVTKDPRPAELTQWTTFCKADGKKAKWAEK